MPPDNKLIEQVEAILRRRRSANTVPNEEDLVPVHTYLSSAFPFASAYASSSSKPVKPPDTHWFCSLTTKPLIRDAATFLIFLFAFTSESTTTYVEALEEVLKGCDRCARAFGAARRTFLSYYLSKFNTAVHANFSGAMDKWEIKFILSEYKARSSASSSSSAKPGLLRLPSSFVQLVLGQPSFLDNADILTLVEDTISAGPTIKAPKISVLGLTPMLVHLLALEDHLKRKWAVAQIPACSHQPLALSEWLEDGIAKEFRRLYGNNTGGSAEDRWESISAMINSKACSIESVQQGMLAAEQEGGDRGIMGALCPLLGTDCSFYSVIFDCFASLLHLSPTHHIWAFDRSPELPHTLFSDIKNNPAFLTLLQFQAFKLAEGVANECSALIWMKDFLLSLTDRPVDAKADGGAMSAFGEALAKILNYCFSEMQHERFDQILRAAAAQTGFEILKALQAKLARTDSIQQSQLFSALDIHASFISHVALRLADHPHESWNGARSSAQQVLTTFFHADGKDIIESTLFLAVIAVTERKRMKKKKQKKPVDPPEKVGEFHRASVRKALWATAYNTLMETSPVGVAIMIHSIAPFAHIEKLDRARSWSHSDLGEVISADDWLSGVRAINNSLHITRELFARTVHSVTLQPEPIILQTFWRQPDVARSAIICLLSPADEIHDAIIGLVQQSFEDVDDRGDCFRILLQKFPAQAMEGLCTFLSSFIITANKTPESCSLAKWLVRCFTDVLEALCQPSNIGPALLHSSDFLGVSTGGPPLSRRVSDLWLQMTTSLAVILKRTPEWAPYFDNEVMVDWMRDALIFGRQMTEHTRVFEAAALGETGDGSSSAPPLESPVKVTSTGKKMIQQLDVVLRDLVSWLRLTDVETLHQTFELVKTILERISKGSRDITDETPLKETLLELDKFCRKATKSYTTRLSDDLLSELSDLLSTFNLGMEGDGRSSSPTPMERTASIDSRASTTKPAPATRAPAKDAFALMMTSSAAGSSSTNDAKAKGKSGASRADAIAFDDFEDDDFLDSFSAKDLAIIEKRAVIGKDKPVARPATSKPMPLPALLNKPTTSTGQKLSINVVPKPTQPAAPKRSVFKSQLMRDLQRENRQFHKDTFGAPSVGGISHRLPAASALASGLGAHQPKKSAPVAPDSGSSASDSSEEEGGGLAIASKQKSPLKPAKTLPAPRIIQRHEENPWEKQQREKEEQRRRQANIRRRLRPDLNPLYRYILSWDPQHNGTNAPHLGHLSHLGKFTQIPAVFKSAQQYEQIMLPLFLQELWAQCIKDQVSDPPVVVEVGGRSYEDDFLDIDLSLPNGTPPKFSLHDSDIVIMKQAGNPAHRQVFAKVQGFQRHFARGAIKIRMLHRMDVQGLAAKTRWQLQKHISLSTALREYAALAGLPYYEDRLLLDILNGRSAPFPSQSPESIANAQKSYDVNEPQAKAILGAMTIQGFSLIQGPPGTGKTKTISGLVGKWMSTRAAAIAQPGAEKPMKAKLLVCAPSNAAIDEVCKRLMNGVPSASGDRLMPNIVRIGVDAAVNDAVKDISLDNLVEAQVAVTSATRGGTEYDRIQRELEEIKTKIREKQIQLQNTSNHDQIYAVVANELQALITQRTQLGQASSKAKDAARDATRSLDAARRAVRSRVLDEADIICATLSGSGQDSLAAYTFETVIIDEAAQAIEMSCLIPLKYGCRRCIMVGDPIQLPPTTFSTEADRYHFNESLFVRMTKQNNANVQLLSIQYRMHPNISELPSRVFYDSRLKDGPEMAKKTKAIWHSRHAFGPYRFFNVAGTEIRQGTSTKNPDEARAAVQIYRRLEADFGDKIDLAFRIGVITMYREQLYEMKQAFNRVFGEAILHSIEFNTVDGFQGQEKDIIILSCVRSGPNLSSIGFLKDPRRMNVALTRAKSSLWVIGNGPTLERSDERWRTIVGDARERGFFINYDANTFVQEPVREASLEPGEIAATPVSAPPTARKKAKTSAAPSTSSTPIAGPSKMPASSSTASTTKQTAPRGSGVASNSRPSTLNAAPKGSITKSTSGDLKRKMNASTDSISGPARKKAQQSSSASDSSDTTSSSDSDDSPVKKPANQSKAPPPSSTQSRSNPANGSSKNTAATAIISSRPAMARPALSASSRPLPPNGTNGGPPRPHPPPNAKPEDVMFIKKRKKPTGPSASVSTSASSTSTPIRQKFNNQIAGNRRP